ncbi:MAG: hypothetical protein U1F11_00990 [Steroidobacteraceae bacterium]
MIRSDAGVAPATAALAPVAEPVFAIAATSSLHLADVAEPRNAAYLAHQVARSPLDLRAHVLRVHLHLERRDEPALWGAFVDLFIVLQRAGGPLKRRLLHAAREVLAAEHRNFLMGRIERGIAHDAHCPAALHAVLAKGIEGTLQFVRAAGEPGLSARDVLVEAREHLEYGQVAAAQALLERTLRADAERLELHAELLAIYRATRDRAAFAAMRTAIAAANPVPQAWQEVAEFLAQGAAHDA